MSWKLNLGYLCKGMLDEQLHLLTAVLKKGRIWALNIGENMNISRAAWERFTQELKETRVSFMYVSEHHLVRTNLKQRMMDVIRENRRCSNTSHVSSHCLEYAFCNSLLTNNVINQHHSTI